MLDRDGKPLGCIITMTDISERRLAEETFRRLAAIVDSSSNAIISKTLDGIILSWNAGAEQIYGYTAAEVLGKSLAHPFPTRSR